YLGFCIHRSQNPNFLLTDLEVERTLRILRQLNISSEVEIEESIRDYDIMHVEGLPTSINFLTMEASNFEIQPVVIQMVEVNQYSSFSHEDPNQHLRNSLKYAIYSDLTVSIEVAKLRLILLSLSGGVADWLGWCQIGSFYIGLGESIKRNLDVATNGALLSKSSKEAVKIIKDMPPPNANNLKEHCKVVALKSGKEIPNTSLSIEVNLKNQMHIPPISKSFDEVEESSKEKIYHKTKSMKPSKEVIRPEYSPPPFS
ncbi:hypothetical protein Gorai_016491, partial [Gossypium raimondii]|nr:hypothetical protein [Gossypium raimondii]